MTRSDLAPDRRLAGIPAIEGTVAVIVALLLIPGASFDRLPRESAGLNASTGLPAPDSSTPLPPAWSLTNEPQGWVAGSNLPLWNASGVPVLYVEGATWCPFCAASSWVVLAVLSDLGGVTNVTLGYSSGSGVYASTPEVILPDLLPQGTSLSLNVTWPNTENPSVFPMPTGGPASSYVGAYAGGAIPFVVVNGQFVHAGSTLVSPSFLSDYAGGANGGAMAVEESVLSETGSVWNATAPQVYLVLAMAAESLGISVDSLAAEYDWGSSLTASVEAAFSSLAFPTYVVTFAETHLPVGASWYVDSSASTNNTTISFSRANGTYAFTVGSADGYIATPSEITVTVLDSEVTVEVPFVTSVPGLSTLLALYVGRPDLEAAFPDANNGSISELAGLVSWAGQVAAGEFSDSAYSSLAAPDIAYYFGLMEVYNSRADLQSAFPNAYTNLTSFTDLVEWAGNVVQGRFADSESANLQAWGYAYDLLWVYESRADLQAAFPSSLESQSRYVQLVDWAGDVVRGAFPDSANGTLQPFGYFYDLMNVYDDRSDLQAAFPDAYGNVTSYDALIDWAAEVVTGQFTDSAEAELAPYASFYETYATGGVPFAMANAIGALDAASSPNTIVATG